MFNMAGASAIKSGKDQEQGVLFAPPPELKGKRVSTDRRWGTEDERRLLRQTLVKLRKALDATLDAGLVEQLLAEMTSAQAIVSLLAVESRALADLVEAGERWRRARAVETPAGHPPYVQKMDTTDSALKALQAIEREVDARRNMSLYERLANGALVVNERARPAPASWVAVRARESCIRSFHLVIAEAILVATGKIETSADTWWRNPAAARRRWAEAVNATLRADRRNRRRTSERLSSAVHRGIPAPVRRATQRPKTGRSTPERPL